MKKIISLFTLILLIAVTASAGIYSGKKFYVNPGHGGHDSNDRPTPMPLGVQMFYESDGNLSRGFGLRDFLEANGGAVKMSRTHNTSADDLGLSTIAAQSNSYGGYFLCLHTNAGNAKANYVIAFYRGAQSSNSYEVCPPSKAMGLAVAEEHMRNKITNTTYDTPRSVSDYAWNGWNYGVLRTNNRPGYLVETFFHDYRPEALRMKSDDYNRYLAWQVARALIKSPGCSGALKGCVVGDIRDLSKSCGYTDYPSRGRDSKLAINGAKVNLKNGSGSVVKTFTTDNCCNGFYGFFNVAAGTYTVEVVKSGYVTKRATVTVKDNASTLKNFDMAQGVDDGISVSTSLLDFGTINSDQSLTKNVTVTTSKISASIAVTSNNANFIVSPSSLPANGGTIKVTYKPTGAGQHSGTIKLVSGGKSATVSVEGIAKNPPLSFVEGWNFSETSGKAESWATDKTKLRNMDFGMGYLYVVNPSDAKIMVIKAQTGKYVKDLNMTGVTGGALKVIDCKCIGDKIVACNLGTNKEPLKVYVWDNMDAAPRVILETTNIGGQARIGDCLSVSGDLNNGKFSFAAGGSNEANKVIAYEIKNGVCNTTPTVTPLVTDDGKGIILGLSPRIIPESSGKYWAIGQNYYPSLMSAEGVLQASFSPKALNEECAGNAFKAFTFNGTQYGIATTYTPAGSAAERLKGGRMVLVDATDGWAQAQNIGEYPNAGLGQTRNTSFSTSVAVSVNGTEGVEMWVLVHNQGIAYYKHGTPKVFPDSKPGAPSVGVSASALSFTTQLNTPVEKQLTVTGANLTGDINLSITGANADMFSVSNTTISKASAQGTVTVKYNPTAEGNHTATLKIETAGANAVEVALSGSIKAQVNNDDVVLEEVWNFSQVSGKTANWITNGSQVTQDLTYLNGNLYVVHRNASNDDNTIYIVDAFTGAKKGALNTAACQTGTYLLSSIETIGGKIIAANLAAGAASPLVVYIWDNDSAEPRELLRTTTHADVRAGDAMSVSGDLESGKIWFAKGATAYYYEINGGVCETNPIIVSLVKDGKAYNVGDLATNNVFEEEDGTIWVSGKDAASAHFDADGAFIEEISSDAIGASKQGTDFKIFTFGTKTYALVTTYLCKTATSLSEGALSLIDMTNGVANATNKQILPANGLGKTRNTSFRSTVCYSIENGKLNVWTLVPNQGAFYATFNGGSSAIEGVEAEAAEECVIAVANKELNIIGANAVSTEIYSISGGLVMRRANENVIDVNELSGLYVVVVVDEAGNRHVAKVII